MSELQLVSDKAEELPAFLGFLYDGLTGYVAGATKELQSDGTYKFERQSFQWPSHKDALIDWIKTNFNYRDVYVAPAIFSEPSGKKEHFAATNVAWAEFDGHLPNSSQMGSIPEPTLRIKTSSGSNEHWYWKLTEPIDNPSAIESVNRALAYQLGADSSGWDANQILRPPSTFNHKYDEPLRVYIHGGSTSEVSYVGFEVLPAAETTHLDVPSVIPDVQEVIFKYQWPNTVATFFRSKVEPDSDRSAMLMRLGYDLAEMGLSDAEMFAVLRNADDRWGKFKGRTDRDRRLSDLISKARIKYPSEILVDEDIIPLYGTLSLLNTEVTIQWVIEGLLQERGYMLLTGPSGVGKTQFSLRVAIAMALGRDFIGFKIERQYKLLFWSLEMGHAEIKFFLSQMTEGMSQEDLLTLEQNLIVAPLGEAFFLDDKPSQDKLMGLISDLGIDGIFIDSIGSSSSGDISSEAPVKAIMNYNDAILRNKLGLFTWYIHHQRKAQGDNKKPNKQADVYGNQYLVNRATAVYCLWPHPKTIEVIPLKKRLSALEDAWHIKRTNNLDFVKTSQTVSLKVVGADDPVIDLTEPEDDDESPVGFGGDM